ncbi:hypothetical protein [Legionella nagasakiensis]|uniref:hypothetical protein n=1 Tax=Legionella nagasakiensis TaxID=535290 RepID=UPI0010568CEC|nr:hypothetical protein [Legionella nagasakiensis]
MARFNRYENIAAEVREAHNHSGLRWESNTRDGVQLVTELMTYDEVVKAFEELTRTTPEDHHGCFFIVESRSERNKYRIAVNLPDLAQKKQLQLNSVVHLLNSIMVPDLKYGRWGIDAENNRVYYQETAELYRRYIPGQSNSSAPFMTDFSRARTAGLPEELIQQMQTTIEIRHHKHGSYAYFKDSSICDRLFKFTESDQAFTRAAAATAFQSATPPLPYDIGEYIGSFLDLRTGGRLARVTKAANQEAKKEREKVLDELNEASRLKPC